MTFEVVAVSLLLVAATILIHFEMLRLASRHVGQWTIAPQLRIVVAEGAALFSHFVQVLLYAAVYRALHALGHGRIHGSASFEWEDAIYFSVSSYTTLGIGDLYPQGVLRLVSGIEALNGLVMIGWTASFTYLMMERFWQVADDGGAGPPTPDSPARLSLDAPPGPR